MAPVRLPALALALAAGIAVAERAGRFAVAPAPWLCALALLVIAGAARGGARLRWLAGAVLAGGAAAAAAPAIDPAPPPGTVADDRDLDRVVGTITGPITRTGDRAGARLVTEPDGAVVWVWAPLPIAPGDRVAITGKLRTPRGFRNPGEPDRAGLARKRGAAHELTATHVEHLGVAGDPPWRWADGVRRRWSGAIASAGDARPAAAAIVRGAVAGDRGAIDDDTDAAWRAAGVYHVLSVSGLHLAVVALLGFAALRRIVAGLGLAPTVPPARWAALPALAAATAYTVITGAEVATIRALLVVGVVLAGAALGRPVRVGDAIGAAAVVLLLYRPASLHDPSFQLSFVAAAVLAAIPERPRPARRLHRVVAGVGRAVIASAWVTAATAPITAAAFGEVAWGGVAGNLVVTPVVELVVIPATLIGLALAAALPGLGLAVIAVAVALTAAVDAITALLATVTPVVAVVPPAPLELALATAAWLAPFQAYRGRWRWRPALALGAAALAALVAARALRGGSERPPGALAVTFLDVGQGDAAVIETPGGEVWLVDAGGEPGLDLARALAPGRAVARYLAGRGVRRIDLAVISHPHPDHYLGLHALLDLGFAIDTVLVAAEPEPPPACRAPTCFAPLVARLRAAGTRVVTPPLGLARVSGGAALHVLAPAYHPLAPPLVAAGDPVRTVNDNSLVVAIEHAGRRSCSPATSRPRASTRSPRPGSRAPTSSRSPTTAARRRRPRRSSPRPAPRSP